MSAAMSFSGILENFQNFTAQGVISKLPRYRLPITARKVSKYGVISGPYFTVFRLNTGKYGPEITPYFDTFHAVY